MKKNYLFVSLLVAITALSSCSKKGDADFNYYYYTPEEYALISRTLDLPEIPFDYNSTLGDGRLPIITKVNISRDLATLGRVLFYDTKLSRDGKISCASCHKQELAFGDDRPVSLGVYDRAGDRNSIALLSVTSFAGEYGVDLNGSQGKRFFWDNRAATATEQGEGSMTNPKEMDMKMSEVAEIVQATPYYEPLFKKAFGDNVITKERVLEAIAGFVNVMGSSNSKFDIALADMRKKNNNEFETDQKPFDGFKVEENQGKQLFMQHCISCHTGLINSLSGGIILGGLHDAASNGLDLNPTDLGVGEVTKNKHEEGLFKIPSLRNIAKTYPYMHDGRFKTLEEVIDFYSKDIKPHANLSPVLKDPATGKPRQFNFKPEEKAALIAFLETLTDEATMKDIRFSNPYK
jgi:cytochrome c peroxidase